MLISDKEKVKYVSMDLANRLKNIGFDWEIETRWAKDSCQLIKTDFKADWNNTKQFISAPTLSTVCEWFFETYDVHIEARYETINKEKPWAFYVFDTSDANLGYEGSILLIGINDYKTKYEALENAIFDLIEVINASPSEEDEENQTTVVQMTEADEIGLSAYSKQQEVEIYN